MVLTKKNINIERALLRSLPASDPNHSKPINSTINDLIRSNQHSSSTLALLILFLLFTSKNCQILEDIGTLHIDQSKNNSIKNRKFISFYPITGEPNMKITLLFLLPFIEAFTTGGVGKINNVGRCNAKATPTTGKKVRFHCYLHLYVSVTV